jgi:histidinol dehydrogenase
MIEIQLLDTSQKDFYPALKKLLSAKEAEASEAESVVLEILEAVKLHGDAAVLKYTKQFDKNDVTSVSKLALGHDEFHAALKQIPQERRNALEHSAERIREYAERQKLHSWEYEDASGTKLGQKITPLDSVGIYVPGGQAAYASSVLMNAIPAKLAGVENLVMVSPATNGKLNEMVLAAAAIAGVDIAYQIGGAQAIAALTYGTSTICAVDKIVGPGNTYVAIAKQKVFGDVGIDMIAGPSEVVVLCDGITDPDWVAMDLLSQAEHDENARAILLTTKQSYIQQVQKSIEKFIDKLPRAEIIKKSLSSNGIFIKVENLQEASEVVNFLAPEHLELFIEDAGSILPLIRHAGAIFLGEYTPEVFGDYCAGPNHVLPTMGTSRFSSPLGVYEFQKRTSIIQCSSVGAQALADTAATMAESEGLDAHALAAKFRIEEK